MKFIVSSSYLLKQLQVLGSVINSSNTLPILDNFLFELDNKTLTVSASDLETTMSATLEIDSESKGSVAVPAKLLLEILKTFPEQPLTFTVEENSTIEISSNSGKYALAYAPGNEFPKSVNLDDPSTTLVPADVLATAISKTIFAAGNDDLRPVMSGVFFQFSPEGLTFVATDAHKLVKYARTDVKSSEVADFIMPKKPLNILKSILGTSDAEIKISALDLGIKKNILHNMVKRGMYVKVFPYDTSFETMESFKPDGYFISNGPGDPEPLKQAQELARIIIEKNKPLFGICLGHQVIALANGISTFKMFNGHRGINHPSLSLIHI